jgi:hypothetical protein
MNQPCVCTCVPHSTSSLGTSKGLFLTHFIDEMFIGSNTSLFTQDFTELTISESGPLLFNL